MEEFLNIDWHPSLDDMIDDVFINEERMKNESVMYKILHGIFTDPFTEFESDDDGEDEEEMIEDEKAKQHESNNDKHRNIDTTQIKGEIVKESESCIQQKKGWIPGLVKPPFRFPRPSVLTKEEQATCLRILLRFSRSEKPEMNQTNRNELELYMKLLPSIKKEQDEFLDLAKLNWNSSQLKIIGKEYVNASWKYKVENIQKLPRYYISGINVPFNGESMISVEFEKTLLEVGQLPRVIIPSSNKQNLLGYHINKLYSLYPVCKDSSNCSSDEFSLYKVPVSQDPNCKQLTQSNEVDLVISSGGLNCLAANYGSNYNSSWILPIIVKENEKGNVAYVDKPLPPTGMTVPQKNAWVYKYILRSQLLHPKHPTSISLSDHEPEELSNGDLFGNLYSDDLLKLEEKEELKSYSSKKESDQSESSKNYVCLEKKLTLVDTENKNQNTSTEIKDEFDLFITEKLSKPFNMEQSVFKQKHDPENPVLSTKSNSVETVVPNSNIEINIKDKEKKINHSQFNDNLQEPEKNDASVKTDIPSTSSPAGRNFVYNIFRLGLSGDTTNDLAKNKMDHYKILVRTRIDGIEKIDKKTMQPVILLPKLEHQVSLGAEAVSAEEALKQWTTLTFRPHTSLARVRISVESSEIIQVERRTPNSISNEIKRLYNLNAESSLVTLYNVVHNLKTLKPGNYLLRHTPSNGAFATIYHEADSYAKNVFDLHATYSENSFQTIPKPPWPPLDKVVVTPAQAFSQRMPAMYYPSNTKPSVTSKNLRGHGKKDSQGQNRGLIQGSKGGNLQGVVREGSSVSKRVRTKKGKKKKNAEPKADIQQS